MKEVLIDVGAGTEFYSKLDISDGDVTASSKIIGCISAKPGTNKELDDAEMDSREVRFLPGAGLHGVLVYGNEGPIHGEFYINYLIG